MDRETLAELRARLSPSVMAAVEGQLGVDGLAALDNQNQNQGDLADLAGLKPGILREIVIGSAGDDDELAAHQNQNQGALEDLMTMKPAVLRELRVNLRGSDEVMDNQNQNQGTQAHELGRGLGKPESLGDLSGS